MTPPHNRHTMEDLTQATGFTARQIRYYITRKLVPGAGERGPNVTYGQETLDRLNLVKRLKQMQVQPTGRSLSLDEIGNTITSLGDEGTRQMIADGMEMSIIDTEGKETEDCLNAIAYDNAPRYSGLMQDLAIDDLEADVYTCKLEPGVREDSQDDLGELGYLLRSLNETLSDILAKTTDETQNTPPQTGAEAWRRVRTPDIEIQVRVPDDRSRRERLERIRGILVQLLEHGR